MISCRDGATSQTTRTLRGRSLPSSSVPTRSPSVPNTNWKFSRTKTRSWIFTAKCWRRKSKPTRSNKQCSRWWWVTWRHTNRKPIWRRSSPLTLVHFLPFNNFPKRCYSNSHRENTKSLMSISEWKIKTLSWSRSLRKKTKIWKRLVLKTKSSRLMLLSSKRNTKMKKRQKRLSKTRWMSCHFTWWDI